MYLLLLLLLLWMAQSDTVNPPPPPTCCRPSRLTGPRTLKASFMVVSLQSPTQLVSSHSPDLGGAWSPWTEKHSSFTAIGNGYVIAIFLTVLSPPDYRFLTLHGWSWRRVRCNIAVRSEGTSFVRVMQYISERYLVREIHVWIISCHGTTLLEGYSIVGNTYLKDFLSGYLTG